MINYRAYIYIYIHIYHKRYSTMGHYYRQSKSSYRSRTATEYFYISIGELNSVFNDRASVLHRLNIRGLQSTVGVATIVNK